MLERTPRVRERVFTDRERAYCDSRGEVASEHYAARFAAKEAALKALKTGWRGGLSWHDVEVRLKELGEPELVFHNRALELFKKIGATRSHISISHTSEYAVAQVVLERVSE